MQVVLSPRGIPSTDPIGISSGACSPWIVLSGGRRTGFRRNLYVKSDTTFIGTNTGVSGPVA